MSHATNFLLDYNLYKFGPAILRNENRETPYMVKLPATRREDLFDVLGAIAVERHIVGRGEIVHLVGIAKSGVPMASAIAEKLRSSGIPVEYSIFNPRDRDSWLANQVRKDISVVLVDNAVTTGDTLQVAAETIRDHGATIQKVVSIFNREEIGIDGDSMVGRIERRFALRLEYIFTVRELLSVVPEEERMVIANYLAKYGTKEAQTYVK